MGTLGSIGSAGTTGAVYITTDSLFTLARANGSTWDYFYQGRQLTAMPSFADNVNFATTTASATSYGPGTRLAITGVAQFNTAAQVKTPVAATFTATVGVIPNWSYGGSGGCGIIVSQNTTTTNPVIFLGTYQITGGALGASYAQAASWSVWSGGTATSIFNGAAATTINNGALYYRIKETASARVFYVSSDNGVTFLQVATESNTAHFTTGKVGIGLTTGNASAPGNCTFIDYTETNP